MMRGDGWVRRLATGALWAGVGRATAMAGFAGLAAMLTLEAFGSFAHGRAAVLLLGPVVSLGLAMTVMRRIPQAPDDAAAAGALALGWSVALAVGSLIGALWLTFDGGWMAAALPAYGALFFGGQAARALERPALGALPLGAAALAAAAGAALGADPAAAWATSLWAAAAGQAALLLRALPRPRVRSARAPLAEALPLTLSLAARGASWQAPLLLLPLVAGAEAVGAFALALLAAQAPLAALGGVAGAAGPRLSSALGRGDVSAARSAARAARLGGLAAAAGLGLGAAGVLAGLGGAAGAAAGPAAILAAAVAVQAVEAPLGLRLLAAGRGRAEAGVQVLGAAVAAAATLAFSPGAGAAGAAAAVLVSGAARLALAWRRARAPETDGVPDAPRDASSVEADREPSAARRCDGRARSRAAAVPVLDAVGGPEAPTPTDVETARDDRPGSLPAGLGRVTAPARGQLWAAIRADHARLGPGRRIWPDLFVHKTFRAVASYRLLRTARLGRRRWWPVAALWHRHCCLAVSAEIAWAAEIGPGLRILHGFAVVVLPCARIGPGATLSHGATVGYRARPEAPTVPVSSGEVGAGAFVGPYAIVQARLGAGSILAPHSVLRDDAPAGWTVGGAPARPLRRLGGASRDAA